MAERNASEAAPFRVDDSPEMVNQPSPPEEQRVSSSTDQQPSEAAGSSEEQQIVSASGQDPPDSAGSSGQSSESERFLTESNEAEPAEGQNYPEVLPDVENQPQPNESSHSAIRGLLEAAPLLPQMNVPVRAIVGEAVVEAGLVRAAVGSPLVQSAIRATQVKTVPGVEQSRSSQSSTVDITKRDIGQESSDDSNQQFDVDDSSSIAKSSPETVALESDASPSGCDAGGEQRGLESSTTDATEDSGYSNQQFDVDDSSSASKFSPESVVLESDASPPGRDTGVEQSSGSSNTESPDLTSESSPTKTGTIVKGSSAASSSMDIVSHSQLSPIKTGRGIGKGSSGSSTLVRGRDTLLSPKRKSPTKVQHLSPKRCSPFPSPVKGASTMVSILGRLEIEQTTEMGSSSDSSPSEENRVEEQTDESEKDESAEDDGIEEQSVDDSLEGKKRRKEI